jgi:Ser-tRNA(Ala) deacylase AlaX
MAEQLHLADSYIRSFEAKITSVQPSAEPGKLKLSLDRTAFYATSGGQPCDLGKITNKKSGKTFEVADVRKENGEIMHTVACGDASDFAAGDEIIGNIDWERRYRLMRPHTAGHVLSAVMYEKGILITGNQLGIAETRFDFNMEEFDRGLIDECIAKANQLLALNKPISISFLPRVEALKLPGMSKLATALPPNITTLRIVDIEGIDRQADGGTHVKNTSEAGTIALTRAENKGKSNRRIYFALKP